MAIILDIYNMKGGVGKTTTACAFASLLEMCCKKVLLIDMDLQANSTKVFDAYDETGMSPTVRDLFLSGIPVKEIIKNSGNSNVSVIPSGANHEETAALVYQKAAIKEIDDPNTILRERIKEIEDAYDFIIIDSSPSVDVVSTNFLVISDYVLSPVQVDGFSYEGLQLVLNRMAYVKTNYNSKLEFLGVLMTQCEIRTTLFNQLYKQFINEFGDNAIKQPIRKDNIVKESESMYVPLYRYEKRSKAGNDYIKAAAEINLISEEEERKLLEWHGLKKDTFDLKELING